MEYSCKFRVKDPFSINEEQGAYPSTHSKDDEILLISKSSVILMLLTQIQVAKQMRNCDAKSTGI